MGERVGGKGPNPDSWWRRVTWTKAHRNAQRYANKMEFGNNTVNTYKHNSGDWSFNTNYGNGTGNIATFSKEGMVYNKDWGIYTGDIQGQIEGSNTVTNYSALSFNSPTIGAPADNLYANPSSQLAYTTLIAMQEAPFAIVPELIAAKYFKGITFYRSMSQRSADIFMKTGKMPAGAEETFISPSRSFAEGYDGVLFKITIKRSTFKDLLKIGVKDESFAHPFPDLPLVGKGWKKSNAFFKVEGNQVNIGLGRGKALNTFNSGIKKYQIIPRSSL